MYRFRPENERILIVPDVHAPFEDKVAWKKVIDFAEDYRPHTIVQLGDFGDCYSVSQHDKDPRRARNIVEEAEAVRELRKDLDGLRAKRKIYCLGNHEDRLERYMMAHAPALLGTTNIDDLYGMSENGWRVIPYGEFAAIGKLHVTHDVGKSGAGALAATYKAVGKSVVIGHTHRLESMYGNSILGEGHVAASLGWLGDFKAADYVSSVQKAPWVHGFGVVEMKRDGTFELQLKRVL